ncbi:hypothetical protein LOC59_01905 [Arthrobacter sp. zg-Y916]|uniref:MFS transporter n=1 Tax=Arthrobacter sp. zg-Y916 TaxID=2894190 RepID=UPI001E2E6C70|nr:MFS transporter [Arthrobacter sp. zg-Y916]MCC9192407.1 hypothetical protein [Arthrobacter sp. zg-Y916]
MNQPHIENEARTDADAPAPKQASVDGGPHAVAGPFGLRDIVVGSAVLLLLIGSVLPFATGGRLNLWSAFSLFFVGIGIIMPVAVAGLFVARRLSPGTRLRVGSLSLDQFASVIAVLAVIFFFLQLVYVFSVGALICLIGAIVLVAATTFAPHIPPFSAEFSGRKEIPAHPVAREALPLARAPKPAPAPKDAGHPAGQPHTGAFGQYPDARQERDARQTAAARPDEGRVSTDHDGERHGAPNAGRPGAERDHGAPAPAGQGDVRPGASGAGAGATGVAGGAAAAAAGAAAGAAGAGSAGAGTPRTGAAFGETAPAGSGTDRPENAQAPSTQASSNQAPSSQDSSEQPAEAPAPAGQQSLPATTVNPAVSAGSPSSGSPATQSSEWISATREENENVVEAFWFAVGTPRQIVDERTGMPLFMFYPGDWELGLEDRGHEFLVQDKRTGRIGVLRDLSNIERVSDENSGH